MLKATTPLDGYSAEFNSVILKELSRISIVSLSFSPAMAHSLHVILKKQFGLGAPQPGKFEITKKDNAKLLWMARDQYFLLFDETDPNPAKQVQSRIGNAAYVTDQSDSHVVLAASGDRVLEALERICMINLHPESFPTGSCARTTMEHIGVTIVKTGEADFLLLSARSSASSFLHAVEQSAKNI